MHINEKGIEIITSSEDEYIKDNYKMKNAVQKSSAIYLGEPIEFSYLPKLFSQEDIRKFDELTQTIMEIIHKVMRRYLADPTYRALFPFPEILEKLILAEHGYETLLPMCRLDFFYNEETGNFKFCEFNTDGTSAMNEDKELVRIQKDTRLYHELEKEYLFRDFELIESWIDELLVIYKGSKFFREENPTVGIVDFLDRGTVEEFEVFKAHMEARGIKAFIADIRDLVFKESRFEFEGKPIDIIYRRAVTTEIMSKLELIPEFIKGALSGETCIIGPMKTQIVHNKIIFKIFNMEETLHFLSDKEKQFIKDHIPLTRELDDAYVDIQEIIENKDKWIIKPIDLYGSKGVYAGLDWTQERWKEMVMENKNSDYLVQEYCSPYMSKLPVFTEDKVRIEEFRNITGVYMYNGKMKGILSRAGLMAVVSGINRGITLATFEFRKK
ncbi:MAG: glutathionylspermidine synthase family protein [Eubacteriaceae bacterium]|nr:glutathionylspermidine synthase family protein [Eubacteriaceae bacterium]